MTPASIARAAAALAVALTMGACATTQAQPNPLAECVATLRAERPANIDAASFETFVKEPQDFRERIATATASQPEFKLHIWDYVARRADAERADEGRALMAQEAATLADIERRHGVDGATVVAVYGVETDYGRVLGRYPVLDATLSRACLRLDSRERKRHFYAALWLLQEGLVSPQDFNGSWAGAFGKTQFMPGTFVENMDDGDGSGRVDIVHSTADALATTARFLKSLRWNPGVPWGTEVQVPPAVAADTPEGHACLERGDPRVPCRTVSQWSDLGVRGVGGTPLGLPPDTPTALLMPAGPSGPAWLITGNYRALWRYNRADAYALSIALLSDMLRGAPPRQAPWPTDDPGISRAELRDLQALLRGRGHCDVAVDGREGPVTGAAVRAEEERLGLEPSGRAGARVLARLRETPGTHECPPR